MLTEVMSLLRTQGQLYGRIELTAPFGVRFPAERGVCLIVTRGSCVLTTDDIPPLPLVGGDFVFMPAPATYTLMSAPDEAVRPVSEISPPGRFHHTRLIEHGGGGAPTSVIAGCFTFASPESEMLVKHLPPIVHLPATSHDTPWFGSTLQHLAAESLADAPGSSAIVDRLAEVLFVQAMRSHIRTILGEGRPSWLRAIADPQIGEALRLMHESPSRGWTIPSLAHSVSMSRSSFADRFRKLVGDSPSNHLTQWRMVRAAAMLREHRPMKMAAVAAAVGYESESSFSKAFKRVMGASPGAYRRQHRQGVTADDDTPHSAQGSESRLARRHEPHPITPAPSGRRATRRHGRSNDPTR